MKTTSIMRIYILLIMFFLVNSKLAGQFIRQGTNINYEPDDWITYAMTRYVTSMAEGRELLYFGTSGGITRYNFYSNSWEIPWTVSDGLPDNYILAVAYDENTNYVWCSTHYGVSVYRINWQRWENVFKDDFGLNNNDDIFSIGFDRQNVWLESKNGLWFKSDHQQTSFSRVSGQYTSDGEIVWFGRRVSNVKDLPELFMQHGYFFDQKGIIKDHRLENYEVTCFTTDNWNTIWVGSWGLNVGKADRRIKILELIPYGLFISQVNAFEFDEDGNLWIGGIGSYNDQSGITFWDTRNENFEYFRAEFYNNIYSDQVTSMTLDYPFVWFGTQYGLVRYNVKENRWETYDTGLGLRDNYILDVEADSNNVWIATLLGLSKLDKRKMGEKDFRIRGVAERDIRSMKVYDIEIMHNLLWIGTEYGVYVYDAVADTGGFENDPEGPQSNEITAIGVLEDKEVWFGMPDGIEVYDLESKSWRGVPERRFYSSSFVNYLVVDDSAAWVATDDGVLKYDKSRKRWRKFTIEDGLASNQANHIVLDGDYIWFGTSEGLTRFYWNSPYRID